MTRSPVDPTHTYAVPVRFDARGYLARAEGNASALACVDVILSTDKGEVEMEPEFGSRLPRLVWEPNDLALAAEMRGEVGGAITRWEPRLTVERVEVRQEQHGTEVTGSMRVRGTGARAPVTVPFSRG